MDLAAVADQIVVYGHVPATERPSPAMSPRRVRVGGSVQAAKLVSRVMLAYPPSAESHGIEGAVILQAVIGTDGQVLSLKPINGVESSLVKSAMDAVQNWRYQPTLLNGEPVEVLTTITVAFRLAK